MIISWGHKRPLASTLLSLARQSSSVFSSWPSSSQVIRCCVAAEVMGVNDEQSYKLLLLLCSHVLVHLPPLWCECSPIACSECQSTPFSALKERSWLKTEDKFPHKYMCVFFNISEHTVYWLPTGSEHAVSLQQRASRLILLHRPHWLMDAVLWDILKASEKQKEKQGAVSDSHWIYNCRYGNHISRGVTSRYSLTLSPKIRVLSFKGCEQIWGMKK